MNADPQLERTFLAGLIRQPREIVQRYTAEIPSDVFSNEKHAEIFRTIGQQVQDGEIDETMLYKAVPAVETGEILKLAGQQVDLARQSKELRRMAHNRALRREIETTYHGLTEDTSPDKIEEQLITDSRARCLRYGDTHADTISDAVEDFDVWRQWIKENKRLLPTGIKPIDDRGGLPPEYILILARTSHGKTAMALRLMLEQLIKSYTVFFVSGEQRRREVMLKLASISTGLSSRQILGIEGTTREERENIDVFKHWVQNQARLHLVCDRLKPEQIRARAQKIQQDSGLDAIYIDQMDKLSTMHYGQKESREARYASASGEIFSMTHELAVPTVMLAQLNTKEQRESSRPAMHQVRDCSQILQDADRVYLIDRPEADDGRWALLQAQRQKSPDKVSADAYMDDQAWLVCGKDRNALGGAFRERVGFNKTSGAF